MTTYPTITVWQPWATLIAYGCKPFEFRGWPAPKAYHGRRVAIHAAARPVKIAEVRALLVKLHSPAWRETGLIRDEAITVLEQVKKDPAGLPLSSIVCLATLGAPLARSALARALGFELTNDSDRHEHTNYGWPLTDVRRLEPYVPARGQQGFWPWAGPAEATLGLDGGTRRDRADAGFIEGAD